MWVEPSQTLTCLLVRDAKDVQDYISGAVADHECPAAENDLDEACTEHSPLTDQDSDRDSLCTEHTVAAVHSESMTNFMLVFVGLLSRSDERRVGKEGVCQLNCRWLRF